VEARNLSNAGRANIRRAQSAIQKLKLLTEDIIVYSEIQNLDGNKTTVDLNAMMESIKAYSIKKMKEEDIRIDCDDVPELKGYPALLSLLFHHLIDNAIKFNQPGVKTVIHIKCSEQKGSSIKNRAAIPGKKYYLITITDNGHGFNPEYGEDLFTMFYRVSGTINHKGSGMGLAICKKIMDIHGGFIAAESIPEKGASFTCYFLKETD
jgi:signal transduction histidine kinase